MIMLSQIYLDMYKCLCNLWILNNVVTWQDNNTNLIDIMTGDLKRIFFHQNWVENCVFTSLITFLSGSVSLFEYMFLLSNAGYFSNHANSQIILLC